MKTIWRGFSYRDFYDVPRLVILNDNGPIYMLDAGFDEERDGYATSYRLYELPASAREVIDRQSWEGLDGSGTLLAEIPLADVEFDPTRRKSLRSPLLDLALSRAPEA